MTEITNKTEAISHLQAEIAALRGQKTQAYSAAQYKVLDARIARLQAVQAFLESDEAEETTESE